jgi:hypothetical protein
VTFPKVLTLTAVLALGSLAGCGEPPKTTAAADAALETAYFPPPSVDRVQVGPGGVTLAGSAIAGGQVRLASPAGEAHFAPVDAKGRWSLVLPAAPEARIFGLAVVVKARSAQAEGYILVTPAGQAALLRAGAGAKRIDPPTRRGLRAIDFDRGGGMEVTAQAAPDSTVTLQMDGRQAAQGRADTAGVYHVSLGTQTPVKPGVHHLQVFGDGFTLVDQAQVQVTPAAPLAQGPLRSQVTAAGLRVDWMTPGGGVQSTLLIH